MSLVFHLQSNGLAERARQSKLRSMELKTEAEETKDRVRNGTVAFVLFVIWILCQEISQFHF